LAVSGFRLRARLGFSIPSSPRPARNYPRFRIRRPSSGHRRDFNPPDHHAAQRTLWTSPTPQPARPVPRGRPVGSRTRCLGSPVLRPISLCKHAVAITPVGPQVGSRRSPDACDSGLPRVSAGSAPTSNVSRPAQRSLALRPACSRGRPRRPFPSEASAVSLPPLPLRLLPAGATVAGWELHPLKIDTLARRTLTPIISRRKEKGIAPSKLGRGG